MKIGEVVELLIRIKNRQNVLSMEEEALIEACNILDKFPRGEEAMTYEPLKNRMV